MKFKIPVTWHMYGEYIVEADSIEDAIEKVQEARPPYVSVPHGEYIDDSMMVDMEVLRELNKGE